MKIQVDRQPSCLFSLVVCSLLALAPLSQASAYEVKFERDSNLPRLDINVAFKVGSISDPKDKLGLTAFFGEMLLRGTKSHSKKQLDMALDQLGAKLDVETRAEATVLRGAVLSSKLQPFLALMREVLTEATFPENEVAKLKKETLSNIQEELGHDSGLASRMFSRFLFQDHAYGNPIIGTNSGVSHIRRTDLLAHYRRIIRGEALLVVGSGDADPEILEQWAKDVAAQRSHIELSETDQKILAPVPLPESGNSFRVQIVDKPDRTQTQITGGQVGVRMTDPDFIALYVGNHSFGGGGFTTTLMTEIREKRGWSYGANSGFRHGLQPRSWYFHLYPAAKDTPPALALTLQLVKDLQAKGIEKNAFEFAKQSLLNNSGFMYNTPRKRVENTLLEKTLNLPDGFMKSYAAKIENVSLADVNQAFRKFLHPDKMAISVLGTAKQLKGPIAAALGVSEDVISIKSYLSE